MYTLEEYRAVVEGKIPCYNGIENVKPAFVNGIWDSNNWNSFEMMELRDIMDTLYYATRPMREVLYVREDSEKCVDCVAVFGDTVGLNDTYYMTITTVRGSVINHYFCEVYKNRGRTDKLLLNNKPITSDAFMEFLNVLHQIYPDKISLK